jgi:hypothetical protein
VTNNDNYKQAYGATELITTVKSFMMQGHYDYTYKDFTYNINKCDITYLLLFTVISKVIYKKNQL